MQVRERRKELGLTQSELAARLEVTGAAISSWERGEKPVPEGRYRDLADALELSVSQLVGEKRYAREGELGSWRDMVFDETTVHPHAQLLLLWLSRKSRTVDGVAAYVGSMEHAATLVHALDIEQVRKAWPHVLSSDYVEEDSASPDVLYFTFPIEH